MWVRGECRIQYMIWGFVDKCTSILQCLLLILFSTTTLVIKSLKEYFLRFFGAFSEVSAKHSAVEEYETSIEQHVHGTVLLLPFFVPSASA